MPRGGTRKGAGRKPRADRNTIKTVQFAGQRWQPATVSPWKEYMKTHGLSQKEFEQQAFDLLINSRPDNKRMNADQHPPR